MVHSAVRFGSGKHLGIAVIAAAALTALIATGASAASRPNTVPLKVRITGLGTVRVTGSGSFTCREYPCVHTFHVQRGRRIAVTATAAKNWKRTTWTGTCKGSGATCRLRLNGWRTVAVMFVPPGNWLNPIPLGKAVTLEGGFRVRVNSATIDATSAVEAVVDPDTGDHPNPPPPAGAQYTLVNVSLTYVGTGGFPADIDSFLYGLSQLGAQGEVSGLYPPDYCEPPQPDADSGGQLTTGQTVTGNLCYVIASDDASSLRLLGVAHRPGSPVSPQYLVWFALR
jgi:hypothetical protein